VAEVCNFVFIFVGHQSNSLLKEALSQTRQRNDFDTSDKGFLGNNKASIRHSKACPMSPMNINSDTEHFESGALNLMHISQYEPDNESPLIKEKKKPICN
jgi:hypothetical protein